MRSLNYVWIGLSHFKPFIFLGAHHVEANRLTRHSSNHQDHLDKSVGWPLSHAVANLLFPLCWRIWSKCHHEGSGILQPNLETLGLSTRCTDWSNGLLTCIHHIPLLHLAVHKVRREEADRIRCPFGVGEKGLVPTGLPDWQSLKESAGGSPSRPRNFPINPLGGSLRYTPSSRNF